MIFFFLCLISLNMTISGFIHVANGFISFFLWLLSNSKAKRVLLGEFTGHSKYPLPTTQDSTHGHHQMVNAKIRLILFFAAKDGEALYSQQNQDQELTAAQIMNSLLPNSDSN